MLKGQGVQSVERTLGPKLECSVFFDEIMADSKARDIQNFTISRSSHLTGIEIEAEQNDPSIFINFSSFLDGIIFLVPDLEELPNLDLTDIPSFQDKINKNEIMIVF